MPYRARPLLALLLLAVLLPLVGRAAPSIPAHAGQWALEPHELPASARLGRANQSIDVFIELRDDPVLVAWSARQGAVDAPRIAAAQAATIEAAQQRLLPAIARIGGRVIYRVQRTLNGIAARIPLDRLSELRAFPELRSVRLLTPKTLDNATSVPLIGAPQLWENAGLYGEGISIGVIDTGVDYLHTMFGGSGRNADYSRNDTTTTDDNAGFPSAKVVGGYDFAGDEYDASSDDLLDAIPMPDPDPMDCQGHGTHVAGTAAGYGVRADGSTYRGPWDTHVPTTTLRIGPGVAPLAEIYALRVFGCAGSTSLVVLALEWATDPNRDFDFADHLDVVNLSLGSPYGGQPQDPDAEAANNTALAGVIVVASSGNAGDAFYVTGTPGSADRAISVASSVDSTSISGAFRVLAPAAIGGLYPATEAEFGPDLASNGPLSDSLAYPGAGQQSGCATFSVANAALIRGRIALLDRGGCSFKAKVANAQTAGASGVLIANNVEGAPFAMGNDPAVTAPIAIPAMMTTMQVGALLKERMDTSDVIVTLTAEYRDQLRTVDEQRVDAMSSFSSRGARRGSEALKPDVTAPGETIFSAASGTGSRGRSISGTSMAAPQVAGAMALLRELHPGWSVEELKALIMNTAGSQTRTDGASGIRYGPSRQGAGRIMLAPTRRAEVVAFNAEQAGQVSISFGAPQVVGALTLIRNIRVVNKGDRAATYTISVSSLTRVRGVSVTPLVSQITVPPRGSKTFAVQLTVDGSRLERSLDPSAASTQQEQPRHFLSEHSGYIKLSGSNTLRVPFYVAPRPATMLHAAGGLRFALGDSARQLTLQGEDFETDDYQARVWGLELHEHNVNDAFTSGPGDAGDLRYVGVGSDVGPGERLTPESMIFFGIATFGAWSTPVPYDVEFDIYIDTTGDGFADFVLFNWNLSQARGQSEITDVFVAALFDLNSLKLVDTWFLNHLSAATETAPFNATAMVLPASAGALRLQPGQSRITYRVLAYQREHVGLSDISFVHTYDPAAPGVIVGAGNPLMQARDGATMTIGIDRANWMRDQAQGLLLLHHLNSGLDQAEAVPVAVELRQSFVPIVAR